MAWDGKNWKIPDSAIRADSILSPGEFFYVFEKHKSGQIQKYGTETETEMYH